MEQALLLMLGALIGAAGSVGGSIVVNRHELTRQSRRRSYDVSAPEAMRLLGEQMSIVGSGHPVVLQPVVSAVVAMRREAAMAGRRDRRRFEAISEALLDLEAAEREVDGWPGEVGRSLLAEQQERRLARLMFELDQYQVWLEGRVR